MAAMSHGVPLIVDASRRDLGSVIEGGRQKMADGAYEAAVDFFSRALDLKPGLMHALVSRGFCFLTLGDSDRAQRDFAEVITKDAGFNRNIYVLIALCLKRSGEYHKAIRYLTHCISHFATFRPALIARGELSLKIREYDKAHVDFRQVLSHSPTDLVARRGLGDALRGIGNFRKALQQYSRAIEDARQLLQAREDPRRMRTDGALTSPGGSSHEGRSPSSGGCSFEEAGDGNDAARDRASDALAGFASGAEDDHGLLRDPSGGKGDEDDLLAEQHSSSGPGFAMLRDSLGPDADPTQVKSFLTDTLMRQALLLRLMGDLEAAGESLLEALHLDVQDGLALFWYSKILLEQNRRREAPGFLQASIQHNEETRPYAHALLGALHMTWSDADPGAALRHLREAAKLAPSLQAIRVTLWICQGMAALRQTPRDPVLALQHLDRALAALSSPTAGGGGGARAASPSGGRGSPRQPLAQGQTPRKHVAGSGGAAAAVLALATPGKSPEETRWTATRVIHRRRQELAQGGDLELALDCRTFLQLVAEDPAQRVAEAPFLLYALRTVALCDLERWEEAISDCRKALAIDPKDEAAQFTLQIASGILRMKCMKFDAAVGFFSKAIRLQPISSEARIRRAIALARAAQYTPPAGPAASGLGGVGGGAAGSGGGSGLAAAGAAVASTSFTLSSPSVGAGGPASAGNISPLPGGARAMQLLEEAVQDLEAVDQQAQISGSAPPVQAGHLRAACLCSLGRPQEASEVLQQCRETARGTPEANVRQHALEAEVQILLGQYGDAVAACEAMMKSCPVGAPWQVEARLMRGCCWSELGEVDRAFEDYREALVLAPGRADVHEASGELFLMHRCFQEAVTAFTTASKLTEALAPRLTYKRGMAYLALGSPGNAMKDMLRAHRLCPNLPIAARARDGLAAMQSAIDGDFRHAHVRFNVLLHAPVPPALGRLPVVLTPHEVAVYRGVCSLYLGEAAAATQDFTIAADLARQEFAANGVEQEEEVSSARRGGTTAASSAALSKQTCLRLLRVHPDAASAAALDGFECEVRYNIALCQLMTRQYRAALATCQEMLELEHAQGVLGSQGMCLIYYLIGVCCLALGEATDEAARDAFTRSYAHDPRYVDDFLRRHNRRGDVVSGLGPGSVKDVRSSVHGTSPTLPRVGAPPPASGSRSTHSQSSSATLGPCDAAPEAVCCLRPEKSRFSARLPPMRLQVRDVVVWARPSAAWPAIRPCGPAPPPGLARLDLLQQGEAISQPMSASPSVAGGRTSREI